MKILTEEKYIESLFLILKGRSPLSDELQFWKTRFDKSTELSTEAVLSVTGSAVDNTDPINPIINLNSTIPIITNKEYASFYLSTRGLTGQGNIARTVVLNETSVNSNPLTFILLNNEITINKTGNFKIDFGCYFNNRNSSRTEYTFWIEVNGVQIAGSRSGNYQRGYDSGQSSDISMILPIISGDVLRIRVQRTDGSSTVGYQDNNGTRLTIEEK